MTGPLSGLTVVVTRPKAQASSLTARLQELGATVVEIATIAIVEPLDGGGGLDDAMAHIGDFAQVVVASPNGARVLVGAAETCRADRLPPVACVGPSTAAALDGSPWRVNIVPDRTLAEGLLEAMTPPDPTEARLLLVQAEVAPPTLETGLAAMGWQVERVVGYRTVDAPIKEADRAAASRGDVVTFTSSSTVERFVRLVGADALAPVVASIGPITSATARRLGVEVSIEADPHTLDGLIAALVDWAGQRR